MEKISVGILTISDRCYKKEMPDKSGPNLNRLIEDGCIKNASVAETNLVPDEIAEIEDVLKDWCDRKKLNLILTTGGTGLGCRDVTPEATAPLLEKTIYGISNLIFKYSSEITPNAALSRCLSGIRKETLIINLPGSKKAAQESLEAVASVIPHAIDLICNREGKNFHSDLNFGFHSKVKATPSEKKIVYTPKKVPEAQQLVLDRCYALKNEISVPLNKALGCVLAQEIIATENHPSSDVSLKDGYAVISSDLSGNKKIIGTCSIGTLNSNIKIVPGVCAKISTGAALPFGADAVIPVEDTECKENSEIITIKRLASATSSAQRSYPDTKSTFTGTHIVNADAYAAYSGANNLLGKIKINQSDINSKTDNILRMAYAKGNEVRYKGSDFKMGSLLLAHGTYLDSAALGLLASAGVISVRIFGKPKVAVFSTGDELINFENKLNEGKVRDCNRLVLLSLLQEEGFSGSDLGIVPDEPDAIFSTLIKAFKAADVVITSGSMSMGDRDYMKDIIINDFNAENIFESLHMMPGKPTACAILKFEGKTKLWFGLPGNPASVFVTAHLFLIPALRKISGFKKILPTSVSATLTFEILQSDRPQYHRAILSCKDGKYFATSTGSQRSSRIASCVNSNCLLVIPNGDKPINCGRTVEALLIGKNHEFPNNDPIDITVEKQ